MSAAGEHKEAVDPVFRAASMHKRLVLAYFEELAHAARFCEPKRIADTINLPVREGVMIVGVVEGSPADEAGLQGGSEQMIVGGRSYVFGGDIITHADGQAVTSHDKLRTVIMEKEPGDSMVLEIQQADSQRIVNVTLGQQPAEPGG